MASIRNLKKDINNVLGDIIDAVYIWEMINDKNNSDKGNAIIDETIAVFDELIVKVNDRTVENRKAHLKAVNAELEEKSKALIEKVNKLK
ncbi:hypothetical protein GWK08_02430 [Leptobacterium flavescens]|uniref:Uncharacterized protein n=1 Tax=Leptobacterium flavescens TaxID=472055 RepID=A0A6P0UGZ8_9FLAO|nr:hypothetical protein [Leptobacterium flavescens]NER12287.1 hypothetical protein [Leptobacterium flavescens]